MNKNVLLPILKHYILLVLIPLGLAALLGSLALEVFPTILVDFVMFVSPFIFFFFVYRKISKNIKNKLKLLLLSFVIPYLVIYGFYAYIAILAFSKLSF